MSTQAMVSTTRKLPGIVSKNGSAVVLPKGEADKGLDSNMELGYGDDDDDGGYEYRKAE